MLWDAELSLGLNRMAEIVAELGLKVVVEGAVPQFHT